MSKEESACQENVGEGGGRALPDEIGPSMRLIIGDGGGQADAMTPVRWCLNAVAMEEVLRHDMAVVLLSIFRGDTGETERLVIPAENGMEYIQFHRQGKHVVNAALICGRDYHKKYTGGYLRAHVRGKLLAKEGRREYKWCLYSSYDRETVAGSTIRDDRIFDVIKDSYISFQVVCSCSVKVNVPAEFFAKEPPKWLVWWAYLLWRRPMDDDPCSFRRHLIFSIFVQTWLLPIVLTGNFTINVVWALVAVLLFGIRPSGIEWRAIFPLRGAFWDVWDFSFKPYDVERGSAKYSKGQFYEGGSVFFYGIAPRKERPWYWRMLTPIFPLLALGIFAKTAEKLGYSLADALWIGAKILAFLAVFIAACMVLGLLFVYLVRTVFVGKPDAVERRVQERREKEALRAAAHERHLREQTAHLVCRPDLRADVAALPPERQTVHLRFLNLKRRVCRPYAR